MIIFNLPEEENEEINSTVKDVFQALGDKPRVEACRLGRQRTGKAVRPVKVTVANSAVVSQILSKAKNLKNIEGYKSVFVCPDRSVEQRVQQQVLVKDLKRLANEQSDKKHFIRSCKIMSVAKM